MDENIKNSNGTPLPEDTTQTGWNVAPQDPPVADPQTGWNTVPQETAAADTQTGWNTAPQSTTPDSQAGWNAPQQEPWSASTAQTPYQTPVRTGVTNEIQQPGAYHTYAEWQQQNTMAQQSGRRRWKRPLLIAGGVVAAMAIFVGGLFAGGMLGNLGSSSDATSSAEVINPSGPELSISQASASSSTSSSGTLSGDQIYEKVSPSVVSIEATSLTSEGKSSGSGVIMSADGYVITNAHVIEDGDAFHVVTADGMTYSAKVIGSDTKTDIAVIKIEANGKTFTPATFGDSAKIKAGEPAYAIGSPGGVELKNSITTGSISAINRDITINDRVMSLIQTDASINPGNSGGALIDKYGEVIGITNAKLGISYYEGLGFAIPIDSAQTVVNQLIKYGYVPGRPAIGVTGYDISKETAQYNNVPQGVLITAVDARSDAAKKGLQAKDIITGVGGKSITTMNEVNTAKEKLKAGDTMTLSVYRISTGKTMTITITLVDENTLTSTTKTTTSQSSGSQSSGSGSSEGNSQNGSKEYAFPWGY